MRDNASDRTHERGAYPFAMPMNVNQSNTFGCGRALLLSAALAATVVLTGCGGDDPDKLIASARKYMAGNDVNAAIIQLKNALQVRPESAEARLLLGQAMLDKGDPVSAEVELRKALDLRADSSAVLPSLAQALVLEGKGKVLLETYGNTLPTQPAALASFKTSIANAQAAAGDLPAARASLDAALQAVPDFPETRLVEARLKGDAGQYADALVIVDKLLAANPRYVDAWQIKGALLASSNDSVGALKAFDQAIALKPALPGPRWSRLSLLSATDATDADLKAATTLFDDLRKAYPDDPRTFYFGGRLLLQKKDIRNAREIVQQLLKVAPDNPQSLELAGRIELESKALVRAESYLARAVQLDPAAASTRKLLAQTYMNLGQPDKAITTLAPVLAASRPDPEAQVLAASAHLEAGRFPDAEALFAALVKDSPDNLRAHTALALTHIRIKPSPATFDELRAVAAGDKTGFADMALVTALINAKDYEAALVADRNLETKTAGKAVSANIRGQIELLRGDRAAARSGFESALKIDPGYVPSLIAIAQLDLDEGKPEIAEKRFRAVLDANPKNVIAALGLAGMRDKAGATADAEAVLGSAIKANPTDSGLRQALVSHHLAVDDLRQALAAAEAAANELPTNGDVLIALGETQLLADRPNQASATFNKLIVLQPQSASAYMRLARAQTASKEFDAASQTVRRAIELQPEAKDPYEVLVKLELAANRPQSALTVARTVQRQRPDQPDGFVFEGLINLSQKNMPAAVDSYRTALKKAPGPELAARLYFVLLTAGQKAEADKFTVAWLAQHGGDVEFLRGLASVDLARLDLDTMRTHLRSLLKLQPRDGEALNNLAWAMMKSGDKGATATARQAVAIAPKNAAYLDTLASSLAVDGQTEDALRTQKSAVALMPGNKAFRLRLARLYLKSGDKTAARTELEALAQLGDRFGGQSEVQQLIKTL